MSAWLTICEENTHCRGEDVSDILHPKGTTSIIDSDSPGITKRRCLLKQFFRPEISEYMIFLPKSSNIMVLQFLPQIPNYNPALRFHPLHFPPLSPFSTSSLLPVSDFPSTSCSVLKRWPIPFSILTLSSTAW